jgi:putative oxidoreductase
MRLVPGVLPGHAFIAEPVRKPPAAFHTDMRSFTPASLHSLTLLRGTVALIFMAHAVVRLVNHNVPQFGAFLESLGFPAGVVLVWLISGYEIGGGLLLALGIGVRWVCAGLALIVVMGIVLIHAQLGWFVGEHGTGGMEFSVLLVAALLVIACLHESPARGMPSWRLSGEAAADAIPSE